MKKPLSFQDSDSGLQIIIVEKESGLYALKTYMNGFKVDIGAYEFGPKFLEGLQKTIGEFLAE